MASSFVVTVGQCISSFTSHVRTRYTTGVKWSARVHTCGARDFPPRKVQGIRMAVNDLGICRNGEAKEGGFLLPAEEKFILEAVEGLKDAEVIAVPTDTLYGFACDACSERAVKRVYDIKGRSATRPLAICVADVEDIGNYGSVEHLPDGLLGALFPGPVTLILPRGEDSKLHPSLNPGLPSIGVRIPDSSFIRSLCRQFGGALALTSANSSSEQSTVAVAEFSHLWSHCFAVFDAGTLPAGRAGSTIVDLTSPGEFKVLRPGSALSETVEILSRYNLTERSQQNLKGLTTNPVERSH
ncbi:hypothetical protein R1flu_002412 [Riccia fluitans]|uniref:Threonylcarbamoyl-AMP synthase n=1 Tax=Riccia fluitans TaxID=41844 RepID=A0ABD1Y8Z6_9MARC